MRMDEEIKKDIVDELYWDTRIDASKVTVTVEGGVVTLDGEVPTYGDVVGARAAAYGIDGVIDVIDTLTVRYATTPQLPSDTVIRERILNLLAWETVVNDENITVTVRNGVVSLEGTVNAHWKRLFVENKLAGVNGVLAIENKLAIVPLERISDELIAEDVVNALERDVRVNAEDVEVEVVDGIVTLTGSVPRWNARQAAELDASLTAGVIDVINKVTVAT